MDVNDHRLDLMQMVVGAVIDDKGQPICCEMWPGNTADVTTLLPIVERLKKRLKIRQVGTDSTEQKELLTKMGRGLSRPRCSVG